MSRPPLLCPLYREMRTDALGPPLGQAEKQRPARLCWCEHVDSLVTREDASGGSTLLCCGGDLGSCELPPGVVEEFVLSQRSGAAGDRDR